MTFMDLESLMKPRSAGLALYADLLDSPSSKSSAPGTISRGPVVFNQAAGDDIRQGEAFTSKQQLSAGKYQ